MKKIIIITVLAIILIFSVSFQDLNDTENKIKRDYVIFNMDEKPKDLNMTDNKRIREKDLLNSLFEGLVKVDEEGKIVGGLSKEYTKSNDEIEYTFKIRGNAKYSNGDKITAKDFVAFFKGFLSDERNLYREKLNCIYGVSDYINRRSSFENVAISECPDNTLKIRLNKPYDDLINILSQPVMSLRDYDSLNDFSKCNSYTRYTGAFVLKKNEKSDYVLCKNMNYYDKNQVTNNKILLTFIAEKDETLASFEEADSNVDIFIDPPINEILKLTEENKTEGFIGNETTYINFNLDDNSVSSNINFRNAINKSLSKEYFVQKISKDFGVAASSYILNQEKKFNNCSEVTLANKYLNESKYNKDTIVKFLYKDNSTERRIVSDLAEDIMEDLNINIKLVPYDEKDLEKILKLKDFDMILYIHNNEEMKESYYYIWRSENNEYGFSDGEYDKLIDKLEQNIEVEKKNEIYEECEKYLLGKIPSIPVYNLKTVICKKDFIEDIYINKNGYLVLSKLRVSYK